MKPISGNSSFAKFITKMTKNDAMAPIVALESVVVTGRTYQAYKRGKADEARERFLEEISGSIVWLGGVRAFNAVGDKIIEKILKKPGVSFDVGTDKVLRTPFDNFMKNDAPKEFSPRKIALMKGAKVVTSVLLANILIGFIVPHINHAITNFLHQKPEQEPAKKQEKAKDLTFKGGIGTLNAFTNAIENTNAGKLLSTDAGTVSGRMYNARTKEERREIAFRDIVSIYFYMWAQGHVRNGLNFIESGKFTRLNPETAASLDEHLAKLLERKGGEMNAEEFRRAVLGDCKTINLDRYELTFEKEELSSLGKLFKKKPLEVIKVSELEKTFPEDKDLLNRIREMSKIQPERLGEAVLTKQQLIDSMNKAEINDPEFLNKVFNKFTNGASNEPYKYVSNKSLYKLKSQMEDYVETILKEAKGGKINKNLLGKIKNKNITYNGINFAAGFVVAAAFLSTFIPKIQYYITRKATGVDAFPGTYDYEHKHEMVA